MSEFHKKYQVNNKGLNNDFSITWQKAKKKAPTSFLHNQTPLPEYSKPKGNPNNELWQVDVFHFVEFDTLKYVHNIDIYSGCQWVTALSSEKANPIFILY